MSRLRSTARLLLLALGASEGVRLSGWSAPLRLCEDAAAAPGVLAALVREVERETELVPGVRQVNVLERGEIGSALAAPGGWVRYQVEGVVCGLPWCVRFRKAWEGDDRFWWRAESGTGRPDQYGALWLRPQGTGTRLELRVRTRSKLPLLGGAATLLVNPLFLAPTFAGWLRNLARAAEASGNRSFERTPSA